MVTCSRCEHVYSDKRNIVCPKCSNEINQKIAATRATEENKSTDVIEAPHLRSMTEHGESTEHKSHPPAATNNDSTNQTLPPAFEPKAKKHAQWEHKVVTIQQAILGWHNQMVFKVFVDGIENTEIVSGKNTGLDVGKKPGGDASIDQVLNYFAKDGWRVTTALMSQKGDTAFQYVMTRRVD